MGRRSHYAPGTPCSVDLVTPDVATAKDFYRRVFGWESEDLDHGYTVFRHGGGTVAGAYTLTQEMARGHRPGVDDVRRGGRPRRLRGAGRRARRGGRRAVRG